MKRKRTPGHRLQVSPSISRNSVSSLVIRSDFGYRNGLWGPKKKPDNLPSSASRERAEKFESNHICMKFFCCCFLFFFSKLFQEREWSEGGRARFYKSWCSCGICDSQPMPLCMRSVRKVIIIHGERLQHNHHLSPRPSLPPALSGKKPI